MLLWKSTQERRTDMLRGEISNRAAAICGVDYRILVEEKRSYKWFIKNIPELMFTKRFERVMINALPMKEGATSWLERNRDRRIVSISIGVPFLARTLDMVLGDYIAESYHFDDRDEFRMWLNQNTQVYRVYTNDVELLSLGDVIIPHSNWNEVA